MTADSMRAALTRRIALALATNGYVTITQRDCKSIAEEVITAVIGWDMLITDEQVYRVVEAEVADTEDDDVIWHVVTNRNEP